MVVTYSYKFLDILKAEILPRSLLSFLCIINYYLKVLTSALNLVCLYIDAHKEIVGQSLDLRCAASAIGVLLLQKAYCLKSLSIPDC